ncbi:CatB-related O-acetyltransferase [Paenibacillus timonensis]|uniref:CatB-related O-acetyltransferase n=1 Tax=Paenibacillus timonensis TaxID=225915 RepID=UPI003F971430
MVNEGIKFTNQLTEYSTYEIGDWTYGTPKILEWGEGSSLKIGKFCSIAKEVTILLGGEHRTDWVTTYPFNKILAEAGSFEGHPKSKGDVIIGNDVWIGRDALILSGVSIGDGAVIAAGSVITKDIDPYTIVGGNPQRIIKRRFKPHQVDELMDIAWWDWPIEKIQENLNFMLDSDISEFINRNKINSKP